jgi:alpha-tubulin suppressor-like RCC1 family protein
MPIRMDPPSPTPSPTPTPTPSPSPSPDPGDAPLIDLDPLMPLFPARAHLAYGSTSSHSLICTPSGELFAWGSNDSGQLGDSSQSDAHIPVIVSIFGSLIGTRVAQAAVGAHHSLALDARGKVHAWGRISVEEDHAVPHLVSMSGSLVDRECVQVSAGGSHSLVLDTQGQVHVWGSNCFGQLGVSSTVDSSVPSAVYSEGCLAGRRISQVSAGFFHSLALDCSGQVHAWGNNAQGQLGSSIDITHSDVPLAIVSGSLEGKCVTRISAGGSFSLALDSSGILHAWGYNHSGQLGIGSTAPSRVPTAIGYNHNGQVGTPLFGSLLYKTVTDMVASGAHSLALDSDGGIHAWGLNTYGQLGDDSTSQAASPVEITGAGSLSRHATPIQLSGGGLHSLALDACGNIHTWGMNANGQLGSSEVSLRFSDVPISVATCGSNGLITDLISPILHVPCHVSR